MLLTAGCLLYHGRAAAELLANELGPDDPEHLLSAKHEHLREIGGAHDVPCGTDGLQTCNLEVSNLTEVEQLLGNTQGRMRSQRCTSDKLYYMHIGESRKIQCKSGMSVSISHRFVDYQIDTDHGVAIYALSTSTKLVQIEMAITQPPPLKIVTWRPSRTPWSFYPWQISVMGPASVTWQHMVWIGIVDNGYLYHCFIRPLRTDVLSRNRTHL